MKTLAEWLDRKPKEKGKKKRLPARSPRRVSEERIYSAKAKRFLEHHPHCQIWLARIGLKESNVPESIIAGHYYAPRSTEIHHINGRTGGNYLDEKTWLAVSREQHAWVHANPALARNLGLLKDKA